MPIPREDLQLGAARVNADGTTVFNVGIVRSVTHVATGVWDVSVDAFDGARSAIKVQRLASTQDCVALTYSVLNENTIRVFAVGLA